MFYVYVLRSSKTGRRYVGSCENVDDRLRRHDAGHSKATRHSIPWILVHSEKLFEPRRSGEKGAVLQIRTRSRRPR
jgi:predicted GIY-YIG superfamily endonuclease